MSYQEHYDALRQAGVSHATADSAARALMFRDNGLPLSFEQEADINAARLEQWATAD